MNGERFFRALGRIDGDLIEEAAEGLPHRAAPWRRYLAAAACLAVVCGGVFWAGSLRMGGNSTGDSCQTAGGADGGAAPENGAGGSGVNGEMTFMSYAGPVFPLTAMEPDTPLTAEREVVWDFAPGAFADGSPRQWGATVTDSYVLTNPMDQDVTVNALYPVSTSWRDFSTLNAAVSVDRVETDFTIFSGGYAGGFRDAGADDGSTWNLRHPEGWADYRELLADGSYLTRALSAAEIPDIPVTAYWFSDFEAPHEEYDAATQGVEFVIDPSATTVFTYGFNGGSWDPAQGWYQYCYFVPDGVRREKETKVLIVMGEDLGDYTLQGYEDGGCEKEIDGVSCTVTRQATSLVEVLTELCRDYRTLSIEDSRKTNETPPFDWLSLEEYVSLVWQLLEQYGLFADAPMDRYDGGRLDEILMEVLSQDRVLYLNFPVTVPAGGSVSVETRFWKEPSFDFYCSGSENVGLEGYDLVTTLGSTLTFTRQSGALVNTGGVEVLTGGWTADGNGVLRRELDGEHLAFVVRPK